MRKDIINRSLQMVKGFLSSWNVLLCWRKRQQTVFFLLPTISLLLQGGDSKYQKTEQVCSLAVRP